MSSHSARLISRSSGAFSCTQSAPASASARVGTATHAAEHVRGGRAVQHLLGGEIGQQAVDRDQRRLGRGRVGIPQANLPAGAGEGDGPGAADQAGADDGGDRLSHVA